MSARGTCVNIMFITPCFGVAGMEQVVLNIINYLDRSKFNPSLCTLLESDHTMYEKLIKLDLVCYTLNKKAGIDYFLPIKLRNLLIKEKVDLVNSHDIGATLYAVPATKLAGIKNVIHTDHSQILTKSRYASIYRWLMKRWVSFSITVSYDLEKYFITKLKVPRDKITTIPNGIDINQFRSNKDVSYLKKYFRIKREKVIGSIGRLTEQKGYEYLLKAFNIVLNDNANTKLIIVGDGNLRGSLEQLSKDLHIQDKVIFAGIRQDVPNLLRLFDVFVLASLWEGQPITILEAMAAGKPIVATDVGGNAEILGNNKYGLIVPAKDPITLAESIKLILNNNLLAEKLTEDAQSYAMKNLSHISMVRKYEEVFCSIINK